MTGYECCTDDYSLQSIHQTIYHKVTDTESFEFIYGMRDFKMRDFKMHINYVVIASHICHML